MGVSRILRALLQTRAREKVAAWLFFLRASYRVILPLVGLLHVGACCAAAQDKQAGDTQFEAFDVTSMYHEQLTTTTNFSHLFRTQLIC